MSSSEYKTMYDQDRQGLFNMQGDSSNVSLSMD